MADITNIFHFSRPGATLVSISKDGVALPEVYLKSDADKLRGSKPPNNLSELDTINGQKVAEFLETLSSNR